MARSCSVSLWLAGLTLIMMSFSLLSNREADRSPEPIRPCRWICHLHKGFQSRPFIYEDYYEIGIGSFAAIKKNAIWAFSRTMLNACCLCLLLQH